MSKSAYLFWGIIFGFFGALTQALVHALTYGTCLLIPLSIFVWVYYPIMTHLWARNVEEGEI